MITKGKVQNFGKTDEINICFKQYKTMESKLIDNGNLEMINDIFKNIINKMLKNAIESKNSKVVIKFPKVSW